MPEGNTVAETAERLKETANTAQTADCPGGAVLSDYLRDRRGLDHVTGWSGRQLFAIALVIAAVIAWCAFAKVVWPRQRRPFHYGRGRFPAPRIGGEHETEIAVDWSDTDGHGDGGGHGH